MKSSITFKNRVARSNYKKSISFALRGSTAPQLRLGVSERLYSPNRRYYSRRNTKTKSLKDAMKVLVDNDCFRNFVSANLISSHVCYPVPIQTLSTAIATQIQKSKRCWGICSLESTKKQRKQRKEQPGPRFR